LRDLYILIILLSMTQIVATTKRIDFRSGAENKQKLYLLIGAGVLLTALTFGLYLPAGKGFGSTDGVLNAVFAAAVVLAAAAMIISWIVWPPKSATLDLSATHLTFGDTVTDVTKIESWALVELGQTVEIIINKGGYGPNIDYYYVLPEELKSSEFADALNEYIPYDPELVNINRFHFLLRRAGLR
jgi:hypothetical protein